MNKIIGSIIAKEKVQPFVFNVENGELKLGVYESQSQESQRSFDKEVIEIRISQQTPFAFDEIRFDEYFCESCKSWFGANTNQWSYGICLYCSLDRGSELAELYSRE
jgi:hypothetical protein